MHTKRWLFWAGLCLCLFSLFAAGCAPQNAATAQERDQADGAYAVITDDMGRNVRLAEKPQRVVVLSTSLLNMADASTVSWPAGRRSRPKTLSCLSDMQRCQT